MKPGCIRKEMDGFTSVHLFLFGDLEQSSRPSLNDEGISIRKPLGITDIIAGEMALLGSGPLPPCDGFVFPHDFLIDRIDFDHPRIAPDFSWITRLTAVIDHEHIACSR